MKRGKMIKGKDKIILFEVLRNETSLDGSEILKVDRILKEKGILEKSEIKPR